MSDRLKKDILFLKENKIRNMEFRVNFIGDNDSDPSEIFCDIPCCSELTDEKLVLKFSFACYYPFGKTSILFIAPNIPKYEWIDDDGSIDFRSVRNVGNYSESQGINICELALCIKNMLLCSKLRNPITVVAAYELPNGLSGAESCIVIHLCEVLEDGVISQRKRNNDFIRLVLGMSAEHAALRKYRRFLCARFAVHIPVNVLVGMRHVSLEVRRSSTAETIRMGVEWKTGVLGVYLALSYKGRPIPNDIPLYCFPILENAQINAAVIDAEEVDWTYVRTHMSTPATAPAPASPPAPVAMSVSIRNLLLASKPAAQPSMGTWKRPPVPRPTEAPAGVVRLTVKTMMGREIPLEVQMSDTANSVLEVVRRRLGIFMPVEETRLVWMGRPLLGELRMYHYGFQGQEIVYFVQRIRGG